MLLIIISLYIPSDFQMFLSYKFLSIHKSKFQDHLTFKLPFKQFHIVIKLENLASQSILHICVAHIDLTFEGVYFVFPHFSCSYLFSHFLLKQAFQNYDFFKQIILLSLFQEVTWGQAKDKVMFLSASLNKILAFLFMLMIYF